MNSIDYINQLVQALNTINGQIFSLRTEFDQVKNDLGEIKERALAPTPEALKASAVNDENDKKYEEKVQVIVANINKSQKMMDEMQVKLGLVENLYQKVAVDGELDYFKVVAKETSEKLKNLEIAFTLKTNTIERNVRNLPKPLTKEEVQSMIDMSLSMLLEGLKSSQQEQSVSEEVDVQEEEVDVNNSTSTDDVDDNEPLPVEVVIQSMEPVSKSKPKRKYNKKTK